LAQKPSWWRPGSMSQRCEACADDKSARTKKQRLYHVLVERRILSLCDEHARLVRASGAETLQDLRALFPERGGERSVLDRRSPVDRRLFPPRPEGRRRAPSGRRRTDAA
jgi:hypothetical protein